MPHILKRKAAVAAALKAAEVNSDLLPTGPFSHQGPPVVEDPGPGAEVTAHVSPAEEVKDKPPEPTKLDLDDGNAWVIIQMHPEVNKGVKDVWKQGPGLDWWGVVSACINGALIARVAEQNETSADMAAFVSGMREKVREELLSDSHKS